MRLHRSPPSLRWLRTQTSRRPMSSARHISRFRRPQIRSFSSARPRHDQHSQWSADPSNVAIHDMNNRLTWKRAMLWSFYFTSAFLMFKYTRILWGEIGEVAEELEEEAAAAAAAAAEEEDLSDGESSFISLNRPKQLPPQFYKQSDPDWKEFYKLSRDQARQNEIRQEVSDRVGRIVAGNPHTSIRLGKNLKVTRHWLDFKYPDGPPPEYRRFGIEITDQWISLKSQKIPFSHYIQLHSLLWPRSMFFASASSLYIFYRLQILRSKKLLGLELTPVDQQVQRLLNAERIRNQLEAQLVSAQNDKEAVKEAQEKLQDRLKEVENPSETPSASQENSKNPSDAPTQAPSITSSIWSAITHPRSVISNTDTRLSYLLSWIPAPPIPPPDVLLQPLTKNSELSLGWRFFASQLNKSWAQAKMDLAPKGALFVVGQVEVTGSLARCKVDVNAAYDPRASQILYTLCTPKHIWEHSQNAKGGP